MLATAHVQPCESHRPPVCKQAPQWAAGAGGPPRASPELGAKWPMASPHMVTGKLFSRRSLCIHKYVCIYMCAYIHTYMYVCVCRCVCIYIYLCIYIHILDLDTRLNVYRISFFLFMKLRFTSDPCHQTPPAELLGGTCRDLSGRI